MTIGRMLQPVINAPRYKWYEQRKHRRIPSEAEAKKYIDAFFTKVDNITAPITVGTLSPWTEVQNTGNKTYNAATGFSGTGITYSLATGATGVSINASTGIVTANTATTGTGVKNLVVRASNIAGSADQPLTLTVSTGLTAPITVGTLGPWAITNATGNQTFATVGGFSGASIVYSLQVGATGYSINSSTGVITANTASTSAGVTNLTVRASNGAGFADQPLTVNVAIAAPTASGTLGPFSYTKGTGNQTFATATGFTGGSLTYSLPTGATGISINTSTGVVTVDTATATAGTKNIVVRATNVSGSADQPVTVNIASPAISFLGASAVQATVINPIPFTDILDDLFLSMAFATGSATPLLIPSSSDWLQPTPSAAITTHLEAGGTRAGVMGYKFSDNPGAETCTGWTGAGTLTLGGYRSVDKTNPILACAFSTNTDDTIVWPALTYSDPNAWVILAARSFNSVVPLAPASFTTRSSANRRIIADSNGPMASFAGAAAATVTGMGYWIACAISIKKLTP